MALEVGRGRSRAGVPSSGTPSMSLYMHGQSTSSGLAPRGVRGRAGHAWTLPWPSLLARTTCRAPQRDRLVRHCLYKGPSQSIGVDRNYLAPLRRPLGAQSGSPPQRRIRGDLGEDGHQHFCPLLPSVEQTTRARFPPDRDKARVTARRPGWLLLLLLLLGPGISRRRQLIVGTHRACDRSAVRKDMAADWITARRCRSLTAWLKMGNAITMK